MNVRSITVGTPIDALRDHATLGRRLRDFLAAMNGAFGSHDIAVRTNRITLSPFREQPGQLVNQHQVLGLVRAVSSLCEELDIRWFNVPFDLTRHEQRDTLDGLCEAAFEVVRRFPRSFVNFLCADGGRISYQAASRAAAFIKAVAGLETSGYHNFRVGVGCNVKAGTPFFPFAYAGDELGFSIGLELPQVMMKVVNGMRGAPLPAVREALLAALLPGVQQIEALASLTASEHGLAFHGVDVSIAPYPEPDGSVAQLMELLGLEQYGGQGTLFVTAFLTDILKELIARGRLRTVGFNGVMLSLLEDEYMGRRNNYSTYSIDSLILYSTVCGCGVDMVPIPGDTFDEEIAAMILDVATASTVLGKPLGVRLLPIPSRQENEFTAFNMDFLFNTRIKKMRNLGFVGGQLRADPFEFLQKRTP